MSQLFFGCCFFFIFSNKKAIIFWGFFVRTYRFLLTLSLKNKTAHYHELYFEVVFAVNKKIVLFYLILIFMISFTTEILAADPECCYEDYQSCNNKHVHGVTCYCIIFSVFHTTENEHGSSFLQLYIFQ